MENHELDNSDFNEIIERDEKEQKLEIFSFEYDNAAPNCNPHNPFKRRVIFQILKERRLVSGRVDFELPDNSIQTSKYTAMSFVPKNLLEQFSKKANLYFLFIGIMQTLPFISISEGIPAIFLPLFVVLAVTAFKDFFEDNKRKKSDMEENTQKVTIWEQGQWKDSLWKNLKPGNIIKNEYVPADVILLGTSEKRGICYVETKNLDGETNLKSKIVPKELSRLFKTEQFSLNRVIFQYERPSNYIYCFKGNFITDAGEVNPLDISNFILRGCCLRNASYIVGFVAYTGHETKIMMNSFRAKAKLSTLEKMMNRQILIIFLVQKIVLCLLCSIVYSSFYQANKDFLPYLRIDQTQITDNAFFYNLFIRYGNWTLIFTNFVPISLLVTLETVKVIQGIFMHKDCKMGVRDLALNVQSSSLNEELGQIEYVFSDKTGTLTCNKMDFKRISINGKSYGKIDPSNPKYISDFSVFPSVQNVDFHDGVLIDELQGELADEALRNGIFFLSICHSVICEASNGPMVYSAASPDELAFVNFAKFCGFQFKGMNENREIVIKIDKKDRVFKFLYEFEFNSERKRHTVIFEDKKGRIRLFCKGADSVIEGLLDLRQSNKNQIYEKTWNHLKGFGTDGLRTLVLAEKELDREVFEVWRRKYELAKNQLENRADRIRALQEEIEKELSLVGATAVEDKLQSEVDSTIKALRNAGIKVWVLTGDKIETAVNIGFSCGLLDSDLNRFILEDKTEGQLEESFHRIQEEIDKSQDDNNALIIHGDSLLHIVIKPFFCKKMMEICKKCSSVLCCRVSPKQKQEVVMLIKNEFPNSSTLAIGDGANDVNMITSAHVGIGIKGCEGHQAARASDYSISEFRHLRRLLFFHGRESYRRNSTLVCYNFFKNICLVLPMFFYGVLNFFSGLSLYDPYLYQLFNILYSSAPIVIYGIIDQEYPDSMLVENKHNYYLQGIEKRLFNTKVFWSWFVYGTYVSIVLTFGTFYSLHPGHAEENGKGFEFWDTSTLVYWLVVFTANIQILSMSNKVNLLSLVCISMSIGCFPITLAIYVRGWITEFSGEAISTPARVVLLNLMIICAAGLPLFFLENLRKFYQRDRLREILLQIAEENRVKMSQRMQMLETAKEKEREESLAVQNIDINREYKAPEASNINIFKIKLPDEIMIDSLQKPEILMEASRENKQATIEKSINSGLLIKRSKLEKQTLILTPRRGGDRTPMARPIIAGEIIRNEQGKNQAYLGFAFSQDEVVENRAEM